MENNEKVNFDVINKYITLVNGMIVERVGLDNVYEALAYVIPLFRKTFPINDEEIAILKKILESIYFVKQEEGIAIYEEEYNHDLNWYNKLNKSSPYLDRYLKYLIKDKNFNPIVVDNLRKNIIPTVIAHVGDPNLATEFVRRGLIIGDVQSGKTSNYLGLICAAADAGYNVTILLTGTIESLRVQTQKRVEEGFVGSNAENDKRIGVGIDCDPTIDVASYTSRKSDLRVINTYNANTYNFGPGRPHTIFTIKKNSKVLETLYNKMHSWITNNNLTKMNASCLIIDDEADNASINTNDPKKSKKTTAINGYIRSLISCFKRVTYIGFTATPFANVFIDPSNRQDLFPKDFIYCLPRTDNYFGPKKIFIENRNEFVRYINDENTSDNFTLNHKQDWDGDYLFDSLTDALCAYYITNVFRDLGMKENPNSHRAMLINITRFIQVQYKIFEIISNLHDQFLCSFKLYSLSKNWKSNPFLERTFNVYNDEYINLEKEYNCNREIVLQHIYDSNKNIKILLLNSNSKDKLDYETNDAKENGLRIIAIGGLSLSRGLTLEGLTISYVYRTTCYYDVLMQMGRWFGYREGYMNLCRIYLLPQTSTWYLSITKASEQLRNDIKDMRDSKKTPNDFGVRVLKVSDKLQITARNKMRNVGWRIKNISFIGFIFEATNIYSKEFCNGNNLFDKTKNFLIKNKDKVVDEKVFMEKDVCNIDIIKFLESISNDLPNGINENRRFNIDQIVSYLRKNIGKFINWDIVIKEGEGEVLSIGELNKEFRKVVRSFDSKDDVCNVITLSGKHYRLIGPEDFSIGLTSGELETIRKEFNEPKNNNFLYKRQKPLLLIYFIELKENPKFDINLNANYVSFALGLPTNEKDPIEEKELYAVNSCCDYFNYEHDDLDDSAVDISNIIDGDE